MSPIQAINHPAIDAAFTQPVRTIQVDNRPLQVPFTSPADWRDQWIYFLLVDRFNNPHAAPRAADPYLPYQGGTFEGIRQQLDYLKDLGVGAIWMSPVHFHTPGWEHQTTMALTCLYTMIGIPCLYYGTEQGLSGSGPTRESVREALWGQAAFDPDHPFYHTTQALSALRQAHPALRYGRQYFRPCNGDGVHFGHSRFSGGIIAFSRILNTTEIVVAANTHTTMAQSVYVLIDRHLNEHGVHFTPAFSNQDHPAEPEAVINTGGPASMRLHLRPMEAQVIVRKTED